ncbi:shikimate kinase [Litorihabitans aurantiacus]|uniref:Shikimate kinase n=1 Tax=Litorihabitans aurantiacus TaxID=1930061 RepID=A0AA38CT03_9MICO|nr:shikimate kinase [Litorihabitans aurantiacus]GMA31392.1 hypothetical protein GCM10025875_13840 [Litorihabitans aurantiacus]
MKSTLVLTGPAGAGKSTVGEHAAALLDRPFVDLDEVAEPLYAEVGWSLERLRTTIGDVGRVPAEVAWEEARVHAVVRVLQDHPGAVVALGAGHTTVTSPLLRRDLHRVLAPHLVVRLLPSHDRAVALTELRRRCLADKGTTWMSDGHDFLAEWLDDPNAIALADHVVDVDGGDDAVASAVVELVATSAT